MSSGEVVYSKFWVASGLFTNSANEVMRTNKKDGRSDANPPPTGGGGVIDNLFICPAGFKFQ